MPVLINEVIVTMVIDANISESINATTVSKKETYEIQQKETIRQCVEQVLRILQEKQER